MTRCAVIVAPLSTGQEYADAFRAAGVAPVAVVDGAERSPILRASWHPEKYETVLHRDDFRDTTELAAALRVLDPLCIVPGAEVGVELYEELVGLVLPGTGNDRERADARRDKWAMARALQAAGVPALRQLCSDDADEIAGWIRREGLASAALVVKPPKSGGTDDVHIIPPGTDWRPLVEQIVGKVNLTGLVNEAVLVQEFADGPEFLVDTYSAAGRHGLVDVCRYTKFRRGDRIGIYDRVDFLPPDHPDVRTVWPYVRGVLDAVGIRNGCGHSEVVLTDRGPRLLEVAERPAGGGHQLISQLATGDNHIHRTVAHRVHGTFRADYSLRRHVCGIFLSAPSAGLLRDVGALDHLDALSTFYAKRLLRDVGGPVPETVDLTTVLGWVILSGDDPAAIDADYRRVKELESRVRIDTARQAA